MQNPEQATCTFANLEAVLLAILLFSVDLDWCADCSIGHLAKEEGGISGGQKREGEESKQEKEPGEGRKEGGKGAKRDDNFDNFDNLGVSATWLR